MAACMRCISPYSFFQICCMLWLCLADCDAKSCEYDRCAADPDRAAAQSLLQVGTKPQWMPWSIQQGWPWEPVDTKAKPAFSVSKASSSARKKAKQARVSKRKKASSARISDVLELGRGLKFYIHPSAPNQVSCASKSADATLPFAPGVVRVPTENGALTPVSEWLWSNTDFKPEFFDEYIQYRLACSDSLVESVEEADLCYYSCGGAQPALISTGRHVRRRWMDGFYLEVPEAHRHKWGNCSRLDFQPEASGECQMEVPYMHGVSWPEHYSHKPWEFAFVRERMMAYYGSMGGWKGVNDWTDRTFDNIGRAAARLSRDLKTTPEKFFSSQLIELEPGSRLAIGQFTPPFYREAWELYASANFSWHPHGDTPSRRAVYDSVMFGCVPVIEETAAFYYRRLFNGVLWSALNINLDETFIVIPNGMERDGLAIMRSVLQLPLSEIDQRRRNLQLIAPYLQWGWGDHDADGDAFLMALGSFQSAPLASKVLEYQFGEPIQTVPVA